MRYALVISVFLNIALLLALATGFYNTRWALNEASQAHAQAEQIVYGQFADQLERAMQDEITLDELHADTLRRAEEARGFWTQMNVTLE